MLYIKYGQEGQSKAEQLNIWFIVSLSDGWYKGEISPLEAINTQPHMVMVYKVYKVSLLN